MLGGFFFGGDAVFSFYIGLLIAILGLVSCVPKPRNQESTGGSKLDFVGFNASSPSMGYIYARQPSFKICMKSQVSETANAAHKLLVQDALGQWLSAIRTIDPQVTKSIEFSCDRAPMTWYLDAAPTNGTSWGAPGWIRTNIQNRVGTYLHEFGHAFAGLGDTYVGGGGQGCVAGQPTSIMCLGDFGGKALYPDDINGILFNYKNNWNRIRPAPGQGGGGTVPQEPPADSSGGIAVGQKIDPNMRFAIQVDKQNVDQMRFLVSVPEKASRVFVCPYLPAGICSQAAHGAVALTASERRNNRQIFLGSIDSKKVRGSFSLVVHGYDAQGEFPLYGRKIKIKR